MSTDVNLKLAERGIVVDISKMTVSPIVELFGHVTLVEGHALSSYTGCHALIS